MSLGDLHSALKTEIVRTASAAGVDYQLVSLQRSKEDMAYSIHATPTSFSTAGLQTTDLLAYLGFRRGSCAFSSRRECYAIWGSKDFQLSEFAGEFANAYAAVREAENRLRKCGIPLAQLEGWGFFHGKGSLGRSHGSHLRAQGDGHTSPQSKLIKQAEDDHFTFVMSWIDGGSDKGWTFHYSPKHPPLSSELQAALSFLGISNPFRECPYFDFGPCFWRFFPFDKRDGFFDSNAEQVHGFFDSHSQDFSTGIERLLKVHALMQAFDFHFLPALRQPQTPSVIPAVRSEPPEKVGQGGKQPGPAVVRDVQSQTTRRPTEPSQKREYQFDVAISFAGTERALAEKLARKVQGAGLEVFYDDFYPEQLWGKDLVVLFDDIYRKQCRYCVIFVSAEYVSRMMTNHERRSAQARALEEKGNEYILPIKVDETELPGMPPTIGYLSLGQYDVERIAQILISKLSRR